MKEPEAFVDDVKRYSSKQRFELIKFKVMNRINWIRPFVKGKTVMDIGCGSGFTANELKREVVYICGLDISEENVMYAQERYPTLRFYVHDCRKPFVINKVAMHGFDVVICTEVIEHMNWGDAKSLLANIRKALLPDGLLIGSTPNNKTGVMDPDHVKEYNREELEKLLGSVFIGVEIEQSDVVASTHHFKCWK